MIGHFIIAKTGLIIPYLDRIPHFDHIRQNGDLNLWWRIGASFTDVVIEKKAFRGVINIFKYLHMGLICARYLIPGDFIRGIKDGMVIQRDTGYIRPWAGFRRDSPLGTATD